MRTAALPACPLCFSPLPLPTAEQDQRSQLPGMPIPTPGGWTHLYSLPCSSNGLKAFNKGHWHLPHVPPPCETEVPPSLLPCAAKLLPAQSTKTHSSQWGAPSHGHLWAQQHKELLLKPHTLGQALPGLLATEQRRWLDPDPSSATLTLERCHFPRNSFVLSQM